jgi:hypothetical protein
LDVLLVNFLPGFLEALVLFKTEHHNQKGLVKKCSMDRLTTICLLAYTCFLANPIENWIRCFAASKHQGNCATKILHLLVVEFFPFLLVHWSKNYSKVVALNRVKI